MIANLEPVRMLGKVRIGLALRDDPFEVVFAGQPKKPFAITVHVVAVKESFALFRHDPAKALLAVGQRQITSVLAVAEPTDLFLIVRSRVLVPENVKCIENGLGTAEQQVTELWFAIRIETDYFAIQYAAASVQVASQVLG